MSISGSRGVQRVCGAPPGARVFGLLRPAAVSLAVLIAVLTGFQLGGLQGRYAPGPQLSELSPELKQGAYAARYFEYFTDIPEDSLADFYLGAETSDEDKKL